jgi:hypothetical protein
VEEPRRWGRKGKWVDCSKGLMGWTIRCSARGVSYRYADGGEVSRDETDP